MRGNFILLLLIQCETISNNGETSNIERKSNNMKRQSVHVVLIMSHDCG